MPDPDHKPQSNNDIITFTLIIRDNSNGELQHLRPNAVLESPRNRPHQFLSCDWPGHGAVTSERNGGKSTSTLQLITFAYRCCEVLPNLRSFSPTLSGVSL